MMLDRFVNKNKIFCKQCWKICSTSSPVLPRSSLFQNIRNPLSLTGRSVSYCTPVSKPQKLFNGQGWTRQTQLFTPRLQHQQLWSIIRCQRQMSQSSKPSQSRVSGLTFWQRLLLVGAVVGSGAYVFRNALHEKEIGNERLRYKEFKDAKMGGDWTLTDHDGKQRSSQDFRGQWQLIYFGFTHCPDICPEELEKLAALVKMIDEDPELPNMQPVFITLDPERDSPSLIKDYLKGFKTPRMVGFTGSLEQIRVVAKQFRAYFGKGTVDEDNDYIVDHTIIIYLVNPEGEFVNYYDRTNSAQKIKKSVTRHVGLYDDLKKLESQKNKEG